MPPRVSYTLFLILVMNRLAKLSTPVSPPLCVPNSKNMRSPSASFWLSSLSFNRCTPARVFSRSVFLPRLLWHNSSPPADAVHNPCEADSQRRLFFPIPGPSYVPDSLIKDRPYAEVMIVHLPIYGLLTSWLSVLALFFSDVIKGGGGPLVPTSMLHLFSSYGSFIFPRGRSYVFPPKRVLIGT